MSVSVVTGGQEGDGGGFDRWTTGIVVYPRLRISGVR